MEATTQSNHMDVDKEEARPNQEVSNLPQERHIWRMPELPPIPQGLNHLQVAEIEVYQCQYKNWFREAKEEEWEICQSLWQGAMNSYLHIKSFLGQEKTIELLGDQKKELEMTTALETEGPVASTSSRSVQRQAQSTSQEAERSREPSRKSQLAETLPKRVQDPQIGAFSHGQCLQYGQDTYVIHSQRAGKDEQDFSMQIIDEIQLFKSSIVVELGKFDAKLNEIISDMSELKRNDKNNTEWYQLTNFRLDSITNKCDRIESKCKVQNDEMEDLSILNINDQLRILKDHVLEIIKNTNQFATYLEQSDSERKKKANINEFQVIEEVQCTEEKEESELDSAVSADTPVEDYHIENITGFFEVTEVHTHLPQYHEDCHNLIDIQDARMSKTKPSRGKGYTAGASCITSILMNDIEAKVILDTGAFCTCVGKDYLQAILPERKSHLLPIEGVQFSSASNNI
ncbi:hypothetical protein O181_046983 [Austropuccinia psidii MF-1]|uniref:Uncharacterized protein n=1 Tax=Austropuccinia psidii MF-1 TaxID=1389203 RepID=A0A9Q3DV60_9BASI|nr:hypothetical protein [Austropuccinia psidii MF-1]